MTFVNFPINRFVLRGVESCTRIYLVHDQESDEQKAIRLLNRQLGELQTIRGLNHKHAEFTGARTHNLSLFNGVTAFLRSTGV